MQVIIQVTIRVKQVIIDNLIQVSRFNLSPGEVVVGHVQGHEPRAVAVVEGEVVVHQDAMVRRDEQGHDHHIHLGSKKNRDVNKINKFNSNKQAVRM